MNEYYYAYSKFRQEFGKHCSFEVSEPKLLGAIAPKAELKNQYVRKNPRTFLSDNIMEMSEHMVRMVDAAHFRIYRPPSYDHSCFSV